MWGEDGIVDNYPMAENYQGYLFLDTMNIQNLIMSGKLRFKNVGYLSLKGNFFFKPREICYVQSNG